MTEMVNTDIQIGNIVYTYVGILTTESFKKKRGTKTLCSGKNLLCLKSVKRFQNSLKTNQFIH